MVKPVLIVAGAIPVIFAILIAVPLVTKPEIPTSAVVPEDEIKIEYTKHQLKVVSFGVAERTGSQYTEILTIKDDGKTTYQIVEEGLPRPDKETSISEDKLRKITALIKETGFMEIPSESFPVKTGISEYNKSTIKVTLNDQTRQIHWPEQNATEKFIPPIISMVEAELEQIKKQLIE